MKFKRRLGIIISIMMFTGILAGCGSDKSKSFVTKEQISVISREDGSGTRGAFIELFGVEVKDSNGKKVDKTTDEAIITNSTAVMMTSVSSDRYAIGYISLGSLNDTIQPLSIDGVDPTVENVKNGTYKISRPFNIAVNGTLSPVAQDFVDYILSADGQEVVETTGFISAANTGAYSGTKPTGKIVVAGSSSVTPVMEKLKEAYVKINSNAQIEIQESDSTTGMTSTINKICDIGMASRDLKDSEKASGLSTITIAMDGIVVIVNKGNPLKSISSEYVKKVFTGELLDWTQLIK